MKKEDWKKIVTEYYKSDASLDAESIVFGSPSTDIQILLLKENCPFLPDETIDLYRECNGFGCMENGIMEWLLIPIESIDHFKKEVCSIFAITHPDLARNYVPIFDWGDGNVSGYLNKKLSNRKNIYTFEHESYKSDSTQKWGEFISLDYTSLKKLFSYRIDLNADSIKFGLNSERCKGIPFEILIRNFCEAEMDGEPYELIYGDKLTRESVNQITTELMISFPDDFYEFYLEFNGFGVRTIESGELIWFVIPLNQLSSCITSFYNEFDEKNFPKMKNYVPFVRFGRDSLYGCYCYDEGTRKVENGIYMVDSEDYESAQKLGVSYLPTLTWKNIAHMIWVPT